MSLITVDFETFYERGYSLSNLTTEEYIRDEKFQVIGVSIKIDDAPSYWVTGDKAKIKAELDKIDWSTALLLCHNTQFDGAILSFAFDIVPYIYLDTLSMARAKYGVDVGGSLAALVERFNLGKKGTEVIDAKGKRLEDFDEVQLKQYGEYCKNDVELTYKLWGVVSQDFPMSELKLIDITLRMYTQPSLYLNDALLQERLEEVKAEKKEMLAALIVKLDCQDEEGVRKKLASNKQFAELLTELGVDVPTKKSPTTGKDTFALAKNDLGFIALTEHEDPLIQQLCAVRLGTKSTLEESRIARFMNIGARNKARLPIPLKYYGAHTGRFSGTDGINLQNLPSRDKKKKALKNAIEAPLGSYVVNADSSQIEARILVWLAGQNDITQMYREGRDVYSEFATKIYNEPITKANPVERHVGKTCILSLGYGTGWAKLQHTLKTQPPGVSMSDIECQRLVKVYRDVNFLVVKLWEAGDKALDHIANWHENSRPYYLGTHECLLVTKEGIRLPNGTYIRYPDLRRGVDAEGKSGYMYSSRRGRVSIWGGTVIENVVQALARIVVTEQMVKINELYRPVLTVHDSIVCVVPKGDIDNATGYINGIMSTSPEWGNDLPITCETKYGESYGDC